MSTEKHESYGLASFSRVNGSKRLFQSDFIHHGYISLRINRASLERDLSRDWVYGQEELIEVDMSEAQFVQLITNLNNGSGIPCTISHVNCVSMAKPPLKISEQEQFSREFEKDAKWIVTTLEEVVSSLQEALNSSKIGKQEVRGILAKAQKAHMDIVANLPFVEQSFKEKMQKTISAAKVEVEAYLSNGLRAIGIKQLQEASEKAPKMIEGEYNGKNE